MPQAGEGIKKYPVSSTAVRCPAIVDNQKVELIYLASKATTDGDCKKRREHESH